jgi:hypothetical protein
MMSLISSLSNYGGESPTLAGLTTLTGWWTRRFGWVVGLVLAVSVRQSEMTRAQTQHLPSL